MPNEENPDHGAESNPFMECYACSRTLAADEAEAMYTGRVFVRVTGYRQRLIDEDNLAEKFHVDCCRLSGLLSSDAPDQTKIFTSQVKVATKAEERTEIEITYP